MNNPHLTEQEAQKELAFTLWKLQEARNDLIALNFSKERMRRRAKRQVITWVIGISLTSIALFFAGRELYLNFFWQ